MIIFIMLLVGILIGCQIGLITTGFKRPKGLWNLIPFRVSGWESPFTGEIQKINWIWE